MAHSVGKVVVTNAAVMHEDDVKTLEAIREKVVQRLMFCRVPADSAEL